MPDQENRRSEDINLGKLIHTVETLVSEQQEFRKDQKEFRKEQKKISETTQEIFLWYKDQKELHSKIQSIGLKKIADGIQYVGTLALACYVFYKK